MSPFLPKVRRAVSSEQKKDVYQWENLLNADFGLETGPQVLAVIYVEGYQCALFFEETNHFYGGVLAELT